MSDAGSSSTFLARSIIFHLSLKIMYLVLLINQSASLTNSKLACSYKDTKLQDDSCRVVSSADNMENKFVALGRSL